MWKVFARRTSSETRQEINSGTGKSADIQIAPSATGHAEKIELTVKLYKKNQSYEQESDSVYITVSP